ncbi:MAG TPA: LptF/LptG family permease [Dongiaceae bacterium]|jgi:lipopolysaccharide export system permease protein|nr:LptF/LptG family permease [Dongiaceae bacterium]
MMTFTRYALRTFLWNFFVLWISFTSLLQVVDLLNNSDEVLDRHPRDAGAVVEYAIWRLPELAVFLIPFSVLMAALLSLAKFERSNETLALKSAGAPYYQILLAFLPAVGLVAVMHFTLTDQIVPRSIDHLMERDLYVDKKSKSDEDDQRVWVQDGDMIVEVGQVDKQGLELFNMRLYTRDDSGNITEQKFVHHAIFDVGTRKWTLQEVEDTKVVPGHATNVATTATEPWDTKLGPQEFSELIERPQAMTTKRLWSFATSEQIGVRPTYFYETWLQKRVALPVSSVLMILLAAPVALSFGRRDKGVASGMAIGFGLGFLYFITEGLVQALGESGAVPPFFAAWLPALLFASIGGLWLIRLEGF